MEQIIDNESCCGCNACGDICAHAAISFKMDIEGFWYPEIDQAKCVDCGQCVNVCPVVNVERLKHNDFEESLCYAAEHKNLEVVFDSTSGGLFSALADIMYRDKGFVGGAVFNDDFSVKQYISNDKNDLPLLRSSKYLQSNLEGFYIKVKTLLRDGEKVLVCGSPCQMAALRSFLRKDYDNLIIADYICRGINSPKVWRKYLDSFEERYGFPVVYCKAKSKEYGWRNLTQKVTLSNGKSYYETKEVSSFTKGYLQTGVYCRPSCYQCQFKGYPRMADITLADFWGIEHVNASMEKNLGTSLVMINSNKGKDYFERVKSRINYVEVPFKSIESGNPSLNLPLKQPIVDRRLFFEDLDKMTFLQIAEKYINTPSSSISYKRRLRQLYHFCTLFKNTTRFHPSAIKNFVQYNSLSNISRNNIFLPASYTIVDIKRGGAIQLNGMFQFGSKKFGKSRLESRLLVDKGGVLRINGDVTIGYGSNIEVFDDAELVLNDGIRTNISTTIICGKYIEIGRNVMFGRGVTIRDNNGRHYLNRSGYKDARPVVIGDKVWLCEGCTIMPGVKIGDGAIIGAHALVTANVPAHSMVSGNPAQIVDEDVLWKY